MSAEPTLYRCFGSGGELLYVGRSIRVASRLKSHRGKRWWPEVGRIDLQRFASEAELDIAEVAAIRAERPTHNIAHNGQSVGVSDLMNCIASVMHAVRRENTGWVVNGAWVPRPGPHATFLRQQR